MNTKSVLLVKRLMKYIFAIAFLTIIGVFAYRLVASPQLEEPNSYSLTSEISIISPYPTISSTDWNTYKDEQFGYTIKYPKDWSYQESPDFRQPFVPGLLEIRTLFANYPSPPIIRYEAPRSDPCLFNILIAEGDESAEELLKAAKYRFLAPSPELLQESNMAIGEMIAMRRVFKPDNKGRRETRTYIVLPIENTLYVFHFFAMKDVNPDCHSVFETMLQTFTPHN